MGAMQAGQRAPVPGWSARAQAIAAVLWPSFLSAALATMVFFAFIDPAGLHEVTTPPVELSRTASYGVGFFFFWFVAAMSSAVSAYLLRTAPPHSAGGGGPP